MSLAKLRSNYEGISIEGASEERARIFASPQGALKADEYFEAGKYSIAAEGYLTYLRHNPEDPDDRSIMGRARNSYQRAGYSDMAIWVQEQMMENFPESRVNDLQQLAAMEKEAGLLDDAISHAAESAELDNNTQSKMWTRLYWAWYHQLRDGPAAGLDAYRQVQQEIISAGFDDHRLNERASEKIAEIKKELAAAR
jgi:tetratricopeptide (TPR) repeat protein